MRVGVSRLNFFSIYLKLIFLLSASYIKFDYSFLILPQDRSSALKKEFLKKFQQKVDNIPQSKNVFKKNVVAEDGKNDPAECVWKTSKREEKIGNLSQKNKGHLLKRPQ